MTIPANLEDNIVDLKKRVERFRFALEDVINADKTHYNHHEPRPDGKLPKEYNGTIWLTPKELATNALKEAAQ